MRLFAFVPFFLEARDWLSLDLTMKLFFKNLFSGIKTISKLRAITRLGLLCSYIIKKLEMTSIDLEATAVCVLLGYRTA
jgi:hypothetical protein